MKGTASKQRSNSPVRTNSQNLLPLETKYIQVEEKLFQKCLQDERFFNSLEV
jgi:hypothetical protein